jgi:hypothetical protein
MSAKRNYLPLSQRVFALLLAAYPAEFRREYGREMMQVFRACYYAEVRRKGLFGAINLWVYTLVDLARSAPREHLQESDGGLKGIMRAIRTLVLAIIVYIAAVMIFGKLLVAGKPYLPFAFGAMLDSLLSIGIAFNFIALVLVTTKLVRPLMAVRAACISVVLLLAAFLLLIPASARPGAVAVTTMVLSLLFWFLAHQWWAHRRERAAA